MFESRRTQLFINKQNVTQSNLLCMVRTNFIWTASRKCNLKCTDRIIAYAPACVCLFVNAEQNEYFRRLWGAGTMCEYLRYFMVFIVIFWFLVNATRIYGY